jgi:hypothetical protein
MSKNAEQLKLYGIPADQWGNEQYYSKVTPFFQQGTQLVYKTTADVNSDLRVMTERERTDFVWPVEQEAYGDPSSDVVVLAGEEFAQQLDLLGILHNIRSWSSITEKFYWKMVSKETFDEERATWAPQVYRWLLERIDSSEPLDEKAVNTAVGIIFVYGSQSTQEWVASITALDLIGSGLTSTYEGYATGKFLTKDETAAFTSKYSLRKALKAFKEERVAVQNR